MHDAVSNAVTTKHNHIGIATELKKERTKNILKKMKNSS